MDPFPVPRQADTDPLKAYSTTGHVPQDCWLSDVLPQFAAVSLDLGTQPGSYGYGGTGKKSTDRKFEDYGGKFGQVRA